MRNILLFLILSIILILPASSFSISIIPGVNGFGMDTRAAYEPNNNPEICIVNTLTDNNEDLINIVRNGVSVKTGTLRGCLRFSPGIETGKIILFEVSGVIDITKRGVLKLYNPYNIIAGQTAPSPGITIRGGALRVGNAHDSTKSAHDTLIQHIRWRVGDDPSGPFGENRDGLNIHSSDVVIDHCSISWAIDENVEISNYSGGKELADRITFINSIISEGLINPKAFDPNRENHGEAEPEHSNGMLITRGSNNISLIGNVFAHNQLRNPLVNGNAINLYMANNIIYNFYGVGLTLIADNIQASIASNYFIGGQNTYSNHNAIRIWNNISLYLDGGNVAIGCDKHPGKEDWTIVHDTTGYFNKLETPTVVVSGFMPMSTANDFAKKYVIANAGARPADRDFVDIRIVNDIISGTGRQINSQDQVGGWPMLTSSSWNLGTLDGKANPGPIPSNPHGDGDNDGYTNIEEWLHKFSSDIEVNGQNPNISLSPPNNLKIKNKK